MRPNKRSLLRVRAACVVISAVALFLVLRRIRFESLEDTLQAMNPWWVAAATLLFGLLFLPAAYRWHVALGLTNSAVGVGASVRLSLIGHFFYTLLFGAAGGDTAKSVLYARWYSRPLPAILAASSLDRLLGFGGLILFAVAAFSVGIAHDGMTGFGSVSLRWPWWWLVAAVAGIGLLLFLLKRLPRHSLVGQFATVFVSSGRDLMASPRKLLIGVACGLAVQVTLSAVLAFNLQAVSQSPVPWLRLAWTFPIITVISALPITVAGIGTRESAALVLFGLCGVPETDAVAASLLTALASLVWTAVGGALLWLGPGKPRLAALTDSTSTPDPVSSGSERVRVRPL